MRRNSVIAETFREWKWKWNASNPRAPSGASDSHHNGARITSSLDVMLLSCILVHDVEKEIGRSWGLTCSPRCWRRSLWIYQSSQTDETEQGCDDDQHALLVHPVCLFEGIATMIGRRDYENRNEVGWLVCHDCCEVMAWLVWGQRMAHQDILGGLCQNKCGDGTKSNFISHNFIGFHKMKIQWSCEKWSSREIRDAIVV